VGGKIYPLRTGHVIRRMRLCAVAKNAMSMVGYPVKDVRPMTERERESLFTKYIYITYAYQLLQWQAASEVISPS